MNDYLKKQWWDNFNEELYLAYLNAKHRKEEIEYLKKIEEKKLTEYLEIKNKSLTFVV